MISYTVYRCPRGINPASCIMIRLRNTMEGICQFGLTRNVEIISVVCDFFLTYFQIINYYSGICEVWGHSIQYEGKCILHLREQHTGFQHKCIMCRKLYRRNDNPHVCGAKLEDFVLFNTGEKGEAAQEALKSFKDNARANLVIERRKYTPTAVNLVSEVKSRPPLMQVWIILRQILVHFWTRSKISLMRGVTCARLWSHIR